MSSNELEFFTSPAGRYVSGSISVAKTKDGNGRPLLIKNGPDTGKPTQKFDFGLAIPKGAESSWKETAWGQKFVAVAMKGFPNGQYNYPGFAWKVTDGDSQVPNTKGKKPCDNEGYPRHWIIYFSSNKAPQTVDRTGHNQVDPNSIKKGDWIQVAGSIKANGDAAKPGIFINHNIVSFQWADKAIMTGPDPSTMGFGAAPAPAGASTAPTGAYVAPAPVVAAPAAPAAVVTPAPAAPVQTPAPAAPTPVVPHTAILTPPPPAPTGPVMTAKANGAKYQDFIANGWTDVTLREHGFMV